jgi:hypothetical protein
LQAPPVSVAGQFLISVLSSDIVGNLQSEYPSSIKLAQYFFASLQIIMFGAFLDHFSPDEICPPPFAGWATVWLLNKASTVETFFSSSLRFCLN